MYYNPKESGKRIAMLRKAKGMTHEQLAEKLHISYSMMAKIEIGNKGSVLPNVRLFSCECFPRRWLVVLP